jgi:DNA replication initiation complex subunit (GINS family)
MESSRSVMQMREFENAVAIIREISTIRQQKILFKAIRNGGAHTGTDLMTKDEHELYDRFCAVIEDARSGLETLLLQYESKKKTPNQRREESGAKAAIDAQKGASVVAPASSLKKVRFLKEVPAYKGPNNETLGPFKPGEEGQLPTSEAEWLTRGKLAESLE